MIKIKELEEHVQVACEPGSWVGPGPGSKVVIGILRDHLLALIACVRTELELNAADKLRAKASYAWSKAAEVGAPSETQLMNDLVVAERTYFAAKTAHDAALAKVEL